MTIADVRRARPLPEKIKGMLADVQRDRRTARKHAQARITAVQEHALALARNVQDKDLNLLLADVLAIEREFTLLNRTIQHDTDLSFFERDLQECV